MPVDGINRLHAMLEDSGGNGDWQSRHTAVGSPLLHMCPARDGLRQARGAHSEDPR